VLSSLLLLDLVDVAKGAASEFLEDGVALVKNFLALL